MLREFVPETSESVPQHKLPHVSQRPSESMSQHKRPSESTSQHKIPHMSQRPCIQSSHTELPPSPLQGMTLRSFKIYRSLTADAASHWSGLLRHGGQFLDICTSKQDPSWQTSLPTTYTSPRGWESLRPVRIKEGSAASLV